LELSTFIGTRLAFKGIPGLKALAPLKVGIEFLACFGKVDDFLSNE
jgi:hypothetical protein